MKKHLKKAVSFVVAVFMLFTSFSTVLLADDTIPANNTVEAYSESEDEFEKSAQDDEADPLPLCFSVVFDENGGAGVMDDCEVEADTDFLLPECQFTAPENMEFACWEIGGESYQPGDEYELTDDIVVTAVWKDIYEQQVPDNGDAVAEKEADQQVEEEYIGLIEEIEEAFYPDDQDFPYESDELFAGFAQREFDKGLYGDISFFGRLAGDYFDPESLSRAVYDSLKSDISKVASGESDSTVFYIPDIDELVWTEEELGCDIIKNGQLSDEAIEELKKKFNETVDISRVMKALMSDCPYELYWFDKVEGYYVAYSCKFEYVDNVPALRVINIRAKLFVTENYIGSEEYSTDTRITSAVSQSVANAKAWVESNADKSDREKLDEYRKLICDAVSYDYDSPGGSYGDAWQLVNVFDDDPDTNVVCEGYSKAFQYLCDLSEFEDDVYCYSVSGLMQSLEEPGRHMWNIVSIDGKNYLVDVTNCDKGAIGADNKLFMVTGAGRENNRIHTIPLNILGSNISIVYFYDEDQADLFCDGYLALYYEDNSKLGDINGSSSVNATDVLQVRQYILKKRSLSDEQLVAADVNKNGSVNVTDVLWIRQRILGKRDSNYNLIS